MAGREGIGRSHFRAAGQRFGRLKERLLVAYHHPLSSQDNGRIKLSPPGPVFVGREAPYIRTRVAERSLPGHGCPGRSARSGGRTGIARPQRSKPWRLPVAAWENLLTGSSPSIFLDSRQNFHPALPWPAPRVLWPARSFYPSPELHRLPGSPAGFGITLIPT